ncbi:hypothetical protein QQS21_011306 [Conoideocrella luteorostrata]|uniref:Uncharacterized protein n=1 Tax=Conoideocrella luteorostrata TaxID=1105319 RepID=A0AAJ0FTV2_9HYPO|nr:hypothetical protein QQS21_011306 [Conoideocrella luteorostrata]
MEGVNEIALPTTDGAPAPGWHMNMTSPFADLAGMLCQSDTTRFGQPGQVNSYIKFRWFRHGEQPSSPSGPKAQQATPPAQLPGGSSTTSSYTLSIGSRPPAQLPEEASSTTSSYTFSIGSPDPPSTRTPLPTDWAALTEVGAPPRAPWPPRQVVVSAQIQTPPPRMVPPQFGLAAPMRRSNRLLWDFYIKNWCPGRSVMGKTNHWLSEFARMHQSHGIQAAIHSLAGIYVYDYQPTSSLRNQVSERFRTADNRMSYLLQNSAALTGGELDELITLLVILSMQDVGHLSSCVVKKYFDRRKK